MDTASCPRCGEDVVPRPPEPGAWKLVVAFWAFTLLFGVAAYASPWGFLLLVAWLLLAMVGVELGAHATSWTCPRCGSPMPGGSPTTTSVV
jgi:hypothetical protein